MKPEVYHIVHFFTCTNDATIVCLCLSHFLAPHDNSSSMLMLACCLTHSLMTFAFSFQPFSQHIISIIGLISWLLRFSVCQQSRLTELTQLNRHLWPAASGHRHQLAGLAQTSGETSTRSQYYPNP